MKHQIYCLALCSMITGYSLGQQNTKSATVQQQKAPKKSLEQINYELNAIKVKMEYVKSHPKEMEIAKKEHWFEDMEIYRKTLEKQKALILLQSKSNESK